ncbi:hypothetical protein A2634_04895 [Candidatus Amesbacteria bacterium RIFCSPHIGHO2_01_FULL_48_32]|uniref:Uncharacterized protein n=1 Tax=Candidatus Amesbacteria bacterium RIFCSPLOWO2_01_FULL_48_25 TaxID=1797259 RepID=A0A1F4ZCX7_9BACT|nr:MAG: hypothetical protein A2634_04895 [Candidatus Amesbacteria bacterium RIFCSPHIGHO2_01_FULL_48_32]OGD04005.1 MAG: hypothetical protein A2989_01245 [Candidatus Amesbacteria bacterium RIFCSPLOWO2_01_FULL_48_25]HJZ05731.1 glycosyltransferase family 1 protein [Patescibacteria group bacterium]
MTKIGFVTTPLTSAHSVRGVGFYTRNLLSNLKLLAAKYNFEIIELENYLLAKHNPQIDIENYKLDIVHYPFFDLFRHTLPIMREHKTVVTIHDVVPLEFPDHYPPGLRGQINFQLQRLALSGVEGVITDSYASVSAIRQYLRVPHEKIKLVYLAADPIYKKITQPKNKYKLPKKFVLYVGDINYNKNIPNLTAACRLAKLPLVIIGKQAKNLENLDLSHPELTHLQKVDFFNVVRLGFVSDEDLVHIYNLAAVYCQPSLAEGFGLPVLEALACSTPVACSKTSSLPEIAGTEASYFDPYNINDMAKAIKNAKSANGPTQAAKFSWEKTAYETLQVYKELT